MLFFAHAGNFIKNNKQILIWQGTKKRNCVCSYALDMCVDMSKSNNLETNFCWETREEKFSNPPIKRSASIIEFLRRNKKNLSLILQKNIAGNPNEKDGRNQLTWHIINITFHQQQNSHFCHYYILIPCKKKKKYFWWIIFFYPHLAAQLFQAQKRESEEKCVLNADLLECEWKYSYDFLLRHLKRH